MKSGTKNSCEIGCKLYCDLIEYSYKYFVSHGIPSASAAGIVGNLYHEDLGNPERTVRDSHGTTAYGIAGFNSRGDLPNLMNWAKKHNINGNPNFN